MTLETVQNGRIQLSQSKTSAAVDVPVVEPLAQALAAGPVGSRTMLENSKGGPYSPKTFYQMMKKACIAAGLPHCSPHGLRKSAARRCREAGCTNEEGMAITGHKTEKEYLRYAGDSVRAARADAAMTKVMANHRQKVATKTSQSTGE
ncbi:MAG TPA: tyrosine-type recombinase/integrase [Novosphingobium sp.]|nr:tyrosine-type recombinase/integrase [Novosphingobium sp.]